MTYSWAKSLHGLAQGWTFMLLKIGHLMRDFAVCLASENNILDLDPQISTIWLQMRVIGVWMVSADQDHPFPGQNLLQLGI